MILNKSKLSEVEVGFPVIEDGIYHCRLSAEVQPNKAKTGNNLIIKHEILDPVNDRQSGDPLERKITLTRYISLEPKEKYNPDETLKRLAVAIKSEGDDLSLEDLQGAIVKCKVAYKPAERDPGTGKEYSEGNDIKGWDPVEDDYIAPQM